MKIGILSRSKEYWSTREIIKACGAKDVEPVYLDTRRVQLAVDGERSDAFYEGRSLHNLDCVIPRIGRSLTQLGILILRQFELMGVPTTLSMKGLLHARNKYLALQALHSSHVRIPPSMLIASRVRSDEVSEYMFPPIVMKLLSGTQGIGVMRVSSLEEAGPIIDTLTELDQLICLQKYLPNPGEDIRVFVLGDRAFAAMKRKAAAHEWRSNIHMGGRGLPHELTDQEEQTALAAAASLEVGIAGVDMIATKGVPHVIEVNASPGFRGLLEATGRNAAEAIVDFAVAKAKR